jgi:hypothetical protein
MSNGGQRKGRAEIAAQRRAGNGKAMAAGKDCPVEVTDRSQTGATGEDQDPQTQQHYPG